MLTELLLTQAVKSALGYGFSQVVKAVFADSEGLSDREILDRVVVALRQQGAQMGDLDARLARLEASVGVVISRLPVSGQSVPTQTLNHAGAAQRVCRHCGAVPGEASICPAYPNSGHSWERIRNTFCRHCGAVPGRANRCPPYPNSGHSWERLRDVYCRHCGAVPGDATVCPPYPNSGHSWERTRDVYCRHCGAVPGSATACPPYPNSGHSWSRSRSR